MKPNSEEELAEIIDFYRKHCCCEQSDAQPVAVIVESPSGTGKSVLMDRFHGFLDERKKGGGEKAFVCRGKFEERTAAATDLKEWD